MKKQNLLLLKIACLSAVFTFLFNRQFIGLNLLLFESIVLVLLASQLKWKFDNRNILLLFCGTFISCLFAVVNGSPFTISVNIISAVLLTGYVYLPEARSLFTAIINAACNGFTAQYAFHNMLLSEKDGHFMGKQVFPIIRIVALPLLIIALFLALYNFSNPVFEGMVAHSASFLSDVLSRILDRIEPATVALFVLGIVLSNFMFLSSENPFARRQESEDVLQEKTGDKKLSRINKEVISGVFLMIALNILLLVINIIDIKWVWFQFTWKGEYLKQFVHEGTYLLITSIILSIAIILFYFRGELNFYRKNRFLKILSIAWLIQNLILTISVAIRNIRYIEHFALAYKRIGVIIFLTIVMIGIISVIIKALQKKSPYYLYKVNTLSVYLILLISCLFNWDTIIAKHNFANYRHSFVHYDFLAGLPDKCLPYLIKTKEELAAIDEAQKHILTKEDFYMNSDLYNHVITQRKAAFIESYKSRSILSWNHADYRAYHVLAN